MVLASGPIISEKLHYGEDWNSYSTNLGPLGIPGALWDCLGLSGALLGLSGALWHRAWHPEMTQSVSTVCDHTFFSKSNGRKIARNRVLHDIYMFFGWKISSTNFVNRVFIEFRLKKVRVVKWNKIAFGIIFTMFSVQKFRQQISSKWSQNFVIEFRQPVL